MAGYGATYESSLSNYNDYNSHSKASPLYPRQFRRRVNLVAIVYSVLLPCAIFCTVFYMMSSELRFKLPAAAYSLVAVAGLFVFALLACAVGSQRQKQEGDPHREPNWLMFLFLTALIAWVLAMIGGELNYRQNLHPYLDVQNLATYVSVDTRVTRGDQVMDGGLVTFAEGTVLDVKKSMGFMNQHVYCVAPITTGDVSQASYDFWAVGKDCCSGGAADFHCVEFTKGRPGGLRLLRDSERPYYRLAVQQAEAVYGIKAMHPLYFDWEMDPITVVNSWQEQATSYLMMGMLCYICIQLVFVAVAAIAFAKLGSQGRL